MKNRTIVTACLLAVFALAFIACEEDKDDDPPPLFPILRGHISEIDTGKQIPIYQLDNGVTDAQAIATAEKIKTGYINAYDFTVDPVIEMKGWIKQVNIVLGTTNSCTANGVVSGAVDYPGNYRNMFNTQAYNAWQETH